MNICPPNRGNSNSPSCREVVAFPETPYPGSRTAGYLAADSNALLGRTIGSSRMTSSSTERDSLRRCVFDETAPGDLAVSEREDVRPLLLERIARRLDEASLVT